MLKVRISEFKTSLLDKDNLKGFQKWRQRNDIRQILYRCGHRTAWPSKSTDDERRRSNNHQKLRCFQSIWQENTEKCAQKCTGHDENRSKNRKSEDVF